MNEEVLRALIYSSYPEWLLAPREGLNRLVLCCFHDDHSPSLRLHETKYVYKCFSCGASGGAVDLHRAVHGEEATRELLRKLLDDRPKLKRRGPAKAAIDPSSTHVATYVYTNRQAEELSHKWRWEPARRYGGGPKSFTWNKLDGSFHTAGEGNPHVLYELPLLSEAELVIIHEGEKACDRANRIWPRDGVMSTALPAWGNADLPGLVQQLPRDIDCWLVADHDERGIERAIQLARAMIASGRSLRVVQGRDRTPKADAFDHIEAGFGFDELEEVRWCRA